MTAYCQALKHKAIRLGIRQQKFQRECPIIATRTGLYCDVPPVEQGARMRLLQIET